MLRFSENGPLGRRFFTESRLQVRWSDSSSVSDVEETTIRVNDAFTSGGAQMRGGRQDVVVRAGVRPRLRPRQPLVAHGRAGRRRPATRPTTRRTTSAPTRSRAWPTTTPAGRRATRGGSAIPDVRYSQVQAGVYVQDDWRVLRSLLLSAGVRYGFADPRGRRVEPLAARQRRLVAVPERQTHVPRAATATSTTGSRATSTSRRCWWTATASAS